MNPISRNAQRQDPEPLTPSASQGSPASIRILHLEDDPTTTQLVQERLRRDGLPVQIERVDTLAEFALRLAARSHALILSDFTIPGMDTFEALRLAHTTRPDLPYVFFSGTLGEEAAVEALQNGATDYVLKDRPARLPSAVRRALHAAKPSRQAQQGQRESAAPTPTPPPAPSEPAPPSAPRPWTKTPVARYTAAVLAVVLTWAFRTAIDPALGDLQPFGAFYLPVAVIAWTAGPGPAVLAVSLSWVLADYFFVPPRHLLLGGGLPELIASVVFLGISAVLILVTYSLRRARQQVETTLHSLRESEERFRLFMDHSPTLAWVKDAQGRYVFLNKAYEQRFGVMLSDCQGKTDDQLWDPDTAARLRQADQQALAAGHPVEVTEETTEPDGATSFWLNTKFSFQDHSGKRFIASLGLDITPRKQVEEALRDSEQKLRVALEAGRMGTWVWDIPAGTVLTDPLHRQLWDLEDCAPLVSVDLILNRIHPDDLGKVITPDRVAAVTGPCDLEFRIRRRDGQIRWLRGSATPLRDPSGALTAIVGVNFDVTEQKQAETLLRAALRNVEQERLRLAAVLEALPVGVAIADAEGKVTQFNAALTRIWGTTAVARNLSDYRRRRARWADTGQPLAPEDWALVRTLRTGQPIPDQVIAIDKFDGSGTATILNAAAPIRDPEGNLVGGVAAQVDITEQRRTQEVLRQREAALRQQEKLLRTVLGLLPVGIWIFDARGRLLQNNPAASLLWSHLHHEPDSAFGEFRGRHPQSGRSLQPQDWAITRGLVRGETVLQEEIHMEGTDGQPRFILVSALPITSREGAVTGAVLVSEDITERKHAEQALERRNQHLQLLHQASARLLVGQHPVELLRHLHHQVARAFGADTFMLYQAEHGNGHLHLRACAGVSEAEKQKLQTLRYGRAVCARPAEALQPIIATHLQDRPAPNRRFIRKLGFRSYLYYPLILNHRLHGTVAFASRSRDDYDRTDLDFFHTIAGTLAEALERERLEAELQGHAADLEHTIQERTAKLRETIAELEGFSYSLTHDLRAPLRAMQAYASILEEEAGARLQSCEIDLLRKLKLSCNRMDQLVTDSLNYSRILRQDLPLGPISLGALLRGMVETYPNLHEPQADVTIELGDLMVHGNEAALTQVFSNLLGNAVKFVAPGVHPRVRVWAQAPEPSERVSASVSEEAAAEPALQHSLTDPATGSRVRVFVEDNGIGIPKDQHEKIFGMFQRLHRADEYPGTGIGLALVSKSLERTGGRIHLASAPGQGSCFCVELPLATNPAATPQRHYAHE